MQKTLSAPTEISLLLVFKGPVAPLSVPLCFLHLCDRGSLRNSLFGLLHILCDRACSLHQVPPSSSSQTAAFVPAASRSLNANLALNRDPCRLLDAALQILVPAHHHLSSPADIIIPFRIRPSTASLQWRSTITTVMVGGMLLVVLSSRTEVCYEGDQQLRLISV